MSAPSQRKRDKQRKREEKKRKSTPVKLTGPATESEKKKGVVSLAIMAVLIVVSTIFILSRMN